MKSTLFKSLCLALLCCGIALHATAQGLVVIKTDNSRVYYKASEVQSVRVYGFDEEPDPPQPEEHQWVDLELESGTLWATTNVGAEKPEDYGSYFAWGETQPKNDYSQSTYLFYNENMYYQLTKYCTNSSYGIVDNKKELEPEDDAATINWGEDWQMPSAAQLEELFNNDNTTSEWTTMNGVAGTKITSKRNNKSIFLPAAGYYEGMSRKEKGLYGKYWSKTLDTSYCPYGCDFWFAQFFREAQETSRVYGLTVRPVYVQK